MIIPIEKPTIKNGKLLEISQGWGENPELYLKEFGINGHNGLDLVYLNPDSLPPGESSYGKPILSAISGIVTKVIWDGEHSTKGNGIYIKNSDFETVYWHLSSVNVLIGDRVASGQKIGTMGNSGYVLPKPTQTQPCAGTHLHFALRLLINYNIKYPNNGFDGFVDPLPFLELLGMLKLIGDKRDNKQYVLGHDNTLRWIFNTTLLDDLNNAGVIDKTQVEWKDNIDTYTVGNPWCVVK